MKLVSLSGSLREASTNSILLAAAANILPPDMQLTAYQGLGQLPHFNPDLDGEHSPPEVLEFRQIIRDADGLLLSSPEYAHGIPGTLKNGLDWLVSTMDIVDKPLVVINASSSGGEYCLAQLLEVLRTINARVIQSHALIGIHVRRAINASGQIIDPTLHQLFLDCFEALRKAQPALGDI